MTAPPLNTLTSWPMLRLMLAMQGMEPPGLPPNRSWAVFKQFLALPSASESDWSSFQTSWIRDDPDTSTFVVRYVRQLTDDATGFGPLTRSVEVQFLYQSPPDRQLAERELWREDFDSLEAFVSAVESSPEWKFAVENRPTDGELLLDEESADRAL